VPAEDDDLGDEIESFVVKLHGDYEAVFSVVMDRAEDRRLPPVPSIRPTRRTKADHLDAWCYAPPAGLLA
jgi:hypothetical protein